MNISTPTSSSFKNKSLTTLVIAGLLAGSLSTACAPARASVRVVAPRPAVAVVKVKTAPPAPRYEVVTVRPSKRHVWVKGHWVWKERQHRWVWVSGYWKVPPRSKKVWVAPRYERRAESWVYVAGHWR